VSAKIIWWSDI